MEVFGMANYTDDQKTQARKVILDVRDLLLDHFDWLKDSDAARQLVAECDNTPYHILERKL
jgi:hypothetical protein